MRRNIAISPEMIRAQSGEAAQLLSKLNKLDRNSKQARKIRRQLRRLGVSLSKESLRRRSREVVKRRGGKSWKEKVMEQAERERTFPSGAVSGRKYTKREKKLRRDKRLGLGKYGLEKTDQVLDTAQQLVLAGYKTPSQIGKRLLELYPKIDAERAGKAALQALVKKNPKTKKLWYVGPWGEAKGARIFSSSIRPSRETYGFMYDQILGPFKSGEEAKTYRDSIGLGPLPVPSLARKKFKKDWSRKKLKKNSKGKGNLSKATRQLREAKFRFRNMLPGHPLYKELKKRIKFLRDKYHRYGGKLKLNPPTGAKEIYDRIYAIEAQKGTYSNYPKENFRHDFEPGAKIFGLPDGSILIKGKKKLWSEFEA